MTDRIVTAVALLDGVEKRMRDLAGYVRWHRAHGFAWDDLEADWRREFRLLARQRRDARRIAAAQPDPITAAKAYASWTEGELREAFGR